MDANPPRIIPVSYHEFCTDLVNTEKELAAYHQLADAYHDLAQLPENNPVNARIYNSRSQYYQLQARRCGDFLEKLQYFQREEPHFQQE